MEPLQYLEERLKSVEKKVDRLTEKNILDRVTKLEKLSDRQDSRLDLVERDQVENKLLIKQVFTSLEEVKVLVQTTLQTGLTKQDFFDFFNMSKEEKEKTAEVTDRQHERDHSLKQFDGWQKLLIGVLGGTIVAIVSYIFGQN